MPTTTLEQLRLIFNPKLPRILHDLHVLSPIFLKKAVDVPHECAEFFPHLEGQPPISFEIREGIGEQRPLRVGVLLSGGQAPGGHNVITGLFDALSSRYPSSTLIGFINGPKGLINQEWKELTADFIQSYRNMGGFDMIGAGRTKIETPDQFAAARMAVQDLNLDGLVIIGGDDSNTNAALLAEDFKAHQIKTCVVGVPKTIDGDLKNQWIETSFGFDTACKTFSETIGSVSRDAVSAGKYYFFIKLMGRSASHIALECALQTQPNLTLISEEVEIQGKTLNDVAKEISDMICERCAAGKDYGVILIPEGILEFIPECKVLIQELNVLLVKGTENFKELSQMSRNEEKIAYVIENLSPMAKECFQTLPQYIQFQLILDRDSHGNVQVSKVETERLFIELVKEELKTRKEKGDYKGCFSPQGLFCGYEGRSCLPSNFDANYCYSLGHVAALLVGDNLTGYMANINGLTTPVENWGIGGTPLISMMHQEIRKGKRQPVIRKAVVDLQGPVFMAFLENRGNWILEDSYQYPGPIQFFGPAHLTDSITKTLELESSVLRVSI